MPSGSKKESMLTVVKEVKGKQPLLGMSVFCETWIGDPLILQSFKNHYLDSHGVKILQIHQVTVSGVFC